MNKIRFYFTISALPFLISMYSCSLKSGSTNVVDSTTRSNIIEEIIGDSILIKLRFDSISNINFVGITFIKSRKEYLYSYQNDGITPLTTNARVNDKKNGHYYRYYPSGRLNIFATYLNDRLDGYYLALDYKGDTLLSANYKNGRQTILYYEEPEYDFSISSEVE